MPGGNQWLKAIEKWNEFYTREKKMLNRAKAAHNIALAYEMLDEMESAYEWATVANDLFRQSTSPEFTGASPVGPLQKEIERRRDASGN